MKVTYLALIMLAFTSGCQKPNDSTPPAVAHQFGMQGGACYDYTSATYTAATNCPGMNSNTNNNSTYTMQNGSCVSSTGQQVAASFCTTANNGYNNGYNNGNNNPYQTGGPCYGNYIYNGNGYPEYGYCYGINCRGYALVEAATGRRVNCQ